MAAALGPAFDGAWSHEDVDCSIITVPALVAPNDADSCLRVLLADVNHFVAERNQAGRSSLLIVDEFSALAGGAAWPSTYSSGAEAPAPVSCSPVSPPPPSATTMNAPAAGRRLGRDRFRSPAAAELASLAGSTREAEAAFQLDGEDLTGRQTVTMRAKARVDQDAVRAARVGEARIIAGRVEAVRIIKTNIDANTRTQARELVAGQDRSRPSGALRRNPAPTQVPVDAVAERELPGAAQPVDRAGPALEGSGEVVPDE